MRNRRVQHPPYCGRRSRLTSPAPLAHTHPPAHHVADHKGQAGSCYGCLLLWPVAAHRMLDPITGVITIAIAPWRERRDEGGARAGLAVDVCSSMCSAACCGPRQCWAERPGGAGAVANCCSTTTLHSQLPITNCAHAAPLRPATTYSAGPVLPACGGQDFRLSAHSALSWPSSCRHTRGLRVTRPTIVATRRCCFVRDKYHAIARLYWRYCVRFRDAAYFFCSGIDATGGV